MDATLNFGRITVKGELRDLKKALGERAFDYFGYGGHISIEREGAKVKTHQSTKATSKETGET